MSIWTHAAGTVRVDGLDRDLSWDEVFGKVLRYGDGEAWEELDKNPEAFMPFGSEGSLERSVWENPDECCLASYTVSVFGDLRDYDDIDAVLDWFEGACKKLWVRNAVLEVECETGRSAVAYWNDEKEELVRHYFNLYESK